MTYMHMYTHISLSLSIYVYVLCVYMCIYVCIYIYIYTQHRTHIISYDIYYITYTLYSMAPRTAGAVHKAPHITLYCNMIYNVIVQYSILCYSIVHSSMYIIISSVIFYYSIHYSMNITAGVVHKVSRRRRKYFSQRAILRCASCLIFLQGTFSLSETSEKYTMPINITCLCVFQSSSFLRTTGVAHKVFRIRRKHFSESNFAICFLLNIPARDFLFKFIF